ncbi:MAG: hypothetical protein CML05_03925 [Pseudozobellia sp.]|nr:hypothetical protein [Pseudozobellia sp.]
MFSFDAKYVYMKYLACRFSLLFSLFLGFYVQSQIMGTVVDQNENPVPYVNVVLYQASNDKLLTGAVTNEDGFFSFIFDIGGSFRLGLSSLGYEDYRSDVFEMEVNGQKDFARITLLENTNQLDEVVLSARKNLVQNTSFGKVINVQSSIMTQGSNALQVLERLPGILVDRNNNQFNLNGQTGVTILFNGRRMPLSVEEVMELLSSTSAENIEKVEIITSPSAKYDADGGAGVLNIVFKKNEYEGEQLSLNASVGIGIKPKANTSLQYALGKGSFAFNASYSFMHNQGKNGFEGEGTQNMPVLGGQNFAEFATYFNFTNNTHNLNTALNYQLNTSTEIGADFSFMHGNNNTVSKINNRRQIEGEEPFSSKLTNIGNSDKNNFITSVYMASQLSEKSKLNVDASFLSYGNDNPAVTISRYFDEDGNPINPDNEIFTEGNRGQSKSSIGLGAIKADYALDLYEILQLEIGAKASYAKNENDSSIETNVDGEWQVDPRSQSVISSDEKLWAAYSQVAISLSEKTIVHAGLRFESWQRTIDNATSDFKINQLFPSLSYDHKIGENSSLALAYHKRISRPAYNDLVTSLYYNDPTAIFTGNPLLNPSISNTLRADYTTRNFSVGFSLQDEKDPILRNQFSSTAANDILIISPQNAEYQKSANLFASTNFSWVNWARFTLSSTSSYRKYKLVHVPSPVENSYLFQSLNFNQTVDLPQQWNMELSGWYNFPSYNGSHKTQGFGMANFGLSKTFKNNSGTLKFTVTDIFQSFKINTHNGSLQPIIFDIDTKSVYRDESAFSRIFMLGYSRTFGQMSGRKTRETKVKEELERVD